MLIDSRDDRERAFDALLPLALGTQQMMARVQQTLDSESKLTSPLRKLWHPTQFATCRGSARFAHVVQEWRAILASAEDVRFISSESQIARSIWLWHLEPGYVLRVKHDLDDVVNPGAATLFSLEPTAGSPTVFLTWDTAPGGKINNIAFAAVDEPRWTIPLAELVSAATSTTERVPSRRPQLDVVSKLVDKREDAPAELE